MTDLRTHYERLNDEQKRVVDTLEGPVLVLAGPGTGKTQLLSVRAANIISSGKADPENILILTFTNAGARAMRDRLASIVGHDGYNVEVETFHSFANSVVLESDRAIKFVRDRIELSDIEKVRAVIYALDHTKGIRDLRPFGSPYIHRGEIEKRISELKNEGMRPGDLKNLAAVTSPDGVLMEDKHVSRLKELALVYESYERLKNEDADVLFDDRGRMDYDDMILIAIEALKNDKALRDSFAERYSYIMVDEYQDTNGAQLELLFSIVNGESPDLCCVGDDDQAIYRFQGATLSNFRKLENRFPNISTIALKNNYRSSDEVLELSSRIIGQLPAEERMCEKSLVPCREYGSGGIERVEFGTEEEELAYIVGEVKRQAELIAADVSLHGEERSAPYNNIAVLVRKRAHILRVIDAFQQAGIPYATDGAEDIRQERRVRQMLEVLRLADIGNMDEDEKSLSLYKILTSDYVGAEHSDVLKFLGYVNAKKASARIEGKNRGDITFFEKFMEFFGQDERTGDLAPGEEDTAKLTIQEILPGLKRPNALHRAGWAVSRLLRGVPDTPAHDLILRYIKDTGIYRFILSVYEDDKILRVRQLRALVAFINMVKRSDLSHPGIGMTDLIEEIETRETNGMPIKGEMATMTQDGVRVYTAHASKGLEFHTVIIPFCLDRKNWPSRGKAPVIRLPLSVYSSRERIDEKSKIKLLQYYDELRLFYVASTRAKARLVYTATPAEKSVASQFFEDMKIPVVKGAPDDEEKALVEFLEIAPPPDPFANTESVLSDIVSGLTLNPTSLNNYIKCPRKFLYDNVLRLPGRKNQHLVFGNCAHKALEDVYMKFMGTGEFPEFEFFRRSFMKELDYQGAGKDMRSWCITRLEELKQWYSLEARDPVMPVELENKIELNMGDGLVFRGTFDKVEKEDENSIRVIDYKTSKPDDHVKAIANCKDLASHECDDYYRQLVAYKLLYDRGGRDRNAKVATGVLQFLEKTGKTVKKYGLEKGRYRNEKVVLTESKVDELESVMRRVWRDIRDLKFDRLPEKETGTKGRCLRCDYSHICWGV